MKKMFKRCSALLLTVMLVVAAIPPIAVSAASYPLISVVTDESDATIMKGNSGIIHFMILPEYKNEKYHVELYNSSGTKVGSAEDSYYNTDGTYVRYVDIRVDTKELNLQVGRYYAKYWLSYYSLQEWHDAPNQYTYYFEVVPYVCSGEHTYDSICDPECNACGQIRDVVHTYSGSCDVTCNICGTSRTADGNHTYSNASDAECNVCGYRRVVIPADNSKVIASGKCGANLTWELTKNGTLKISGTGTMYSWESDSMPWNDYKYNGIKNVYIAPGVTSIGNYAFYYTDVERISIPSTVTKIGEKSFSMCQSLREIILPEGIKTIPKYAFGDCSSLETLEIPSSVQSFGQGCFDGCSTLRYLIIPDGVYEIAYGMLNGCSGLEYVQIPSTVTSILSTAFYNCGSLSDVYYGGSQSQYNEIDIASPDKYNQSLRYATIHYNSKAPCEKCSFGGWTNTDSSIHTRTCGKCGKKETQNHSWSSNCDTTCNVCGGTRSASSHTFSYVCDESCNACGEKREVVHTYSSDCDTSCNVCGDIHTASANHTFNGGTKCSLCNTTFGDVSVSSWMMASVGYVYDRGLMSGKGIDSYGRVKFDPSSSITREEFVQVLYNAEGKPSVSIANRFPDVADNGWYKNAVLWANSMNIANGMGNGNFGVGKNISRQDLALMLMKYAALKGCSLDAEAGKINQYADGNKVSDYAKNAMDWAVTNGVLSGKGAAGAPPAELRLDPTGTATRAECAAMLKNFMTAFGL